MRLLRKHHHVSLGLIRDSLDREQEELNAAQSGMNESDILTKPLGAAKHNEHTANMNMDGLAKL